MTDTLTKSARSQRMSKIRNVDTKPELFVRRIVHRMGYRFRLHKRGLPGIPDLAFPARQKIIFVHGCFWHRHDDANCRLARLPKSRRAFWLPKLERNRVRDRENESRLRALGWKVYVVWECQLKDPQLLAQRLRGFLQ